ncbi:MAG: HEPN domain-containing protein [Anaerolineales bacterium]
MKSSTHEWLAHAKEDLQAAEVLLQAANLTNLAAFHAQQAVEKTLKAVLEENNHNLVRTHSLMRLYGIVRSLISITIDENLLDQLDSVYTETRYPGAVGLLPYGKPTIVQSQQFLRFAQNLFEQISLLIT